MADEHTCELTSRFGCDVCGGRYCWMCDECYEEHVPACRSHCGMQPEEE